MVKRCVEGKSGSRVRPPRCGVSSSCSPLWRRCRHDYSPGDAGPWRRLYNDPERAWAGSDPSDGGSRGGTGEPGTRSTGGLGRGLRPVGPMAATRGRCGGCIGRSRGFRDLGHRSPARPRPLRACVGPGTDGCVYPPGHAPGQSRSIRGAQDGIALASHPAAGGVRPGLAGLGDAFGTPLPSTFDPLGPGRRGIQGKQSTKQFTHQGACYRAPGTTALPHDPTPGRPADSRGGEP